jgi:hypothetical protein
VFARLFSVMLRRPGMLSREIPDLLPRYMPIADMVPNATKPRKANMVMRLEDGGGTTGMDDSSLYVK